MDSHSLGLYLREARQAKELTLDDAMQTLKIRRNVLEAFEHGDFQSIEISTVQLRGFLRNYADYLGLDSDLVIQYYESSQSVGRGRKRRQERKAPTESRKRRRITEELSALQQERPDTDTQSARLELAPGSERLNERTDRRRRRRSSLLNTLLIVLVSSVALTLIAVVVTQFLQEPEDDIIPEASNQTTPTAMPTFAPVATRAPLATALPEFQQNFDGRGVALTIETSQRTWMQISVDGIEQLARLVVPGEVFNYRADAEINVTAANAMALVMVYNGQPQPIFGNRGQQVQLQFTPTEVNVVASDILAVDTPGQNEAASIQNTPTPQAITDTPQPPPTLLSTNEVTATLTPTLPGVVSPTPLLTSPPITATEVPPITTTAPDVPTTTATTTEDASNSSATTTPLAQATAILPPRVTPANPTPVKPLP